MNKGALPIISRLHALQTAASLVQDGARVIAANVGHNPLAAMLCEINETVLGRTLTFESSAGPSLSLEVSGRRILRVTAANGLPEAESLLATEALEDEHKDSLIKLLHAAAAPRHELRVRALPMTREVNGVSVGLPVALLADLLLVDLNRLDGSAPPEPMAEADATEVPAAPLRLSAVVTGDGPKPEPEPEIEAPAPIAVDAPALAEPAVGGPFLGAFARAFGAELVAWLIVGGEEDGATDGPDEMVSHLQGFLADEGDALNQQLDSVSTGPENPVSIMLGATLVEGHSILCARMGSGILLGVIEGDAAKTVLRAWASALHS